MSVHSPGSQCLNSPTRLFRARLRTLTSTAPISQGTVTFNSDGTLKNVGGASPASGTVSMTIPWAAASGLTPQAVSVNFGTVGTINGLTQYDAPSVMNGSTTDGSAFGSITGVTVAKDGTLTAQFSNGLSQNVYKIPIATFTNPDGLGQLTGNAYIATKDSGAANINPLFRLVAAWHHIRDPGRRPSIWRPRFTNLITTQRAYSASARIVTTADQMLQQLERYCDAMMKHERP